MSDPRIVLRKELKSATDEQLLKRYCKQAGRLFSDEKHKWARLMKDGRFENTDRAWSDREILIDLIVAAETRGRTAPLS